MIPPLGETEKLDVIAGLVATLLVAMTGLLTGPMMLGVGATLLGAPYLLTGSLYEITVRVGVLICSKLLEKLTKPFY